MSGRGKVSTRGRGARRTATTAANRGPISPGETRISPPKGKSKKTASPLPPQFSFTPADASTSVTPPSRVPLFSAGVKDFPPPPQLFTSRSQPRSGNSGTDPRASASLPAATQARSASRSHVSPPASRIHGAPPDESQARSAPSPQTPIAASPQPQSSEAQNDHLEEEEEESDEDDEEVDGDEAPQPHLAEDVLAALTNLLIQPDRDQYTTVLSPTKKPGIVW